MKLTLKKFAEDMLIMYPSLKDNRIFQRFSQLVQTRAAGEFGIELEMLQVDHDKYVRSFVDEKPQTIKALVAPKVIISTKIDAAKLVTKLAEDMKPASVVTSVVQETKEISANVNKLAEQLKQ
jgi:hypothetical protein